MGWNHRILAREHEGEVYFNIHEVYYKDGIPDGYTANPISVGGESIKSIRWTLNKMKECLKKPILWGDERFPQEYKP